MNSVSFTLCLSGLSTIFALQLAAAPIPGLYNTGVNDAAALLENGAVDPHYRLIQSADSTAPGPDAFVVTDTLFPIVGTGPWLASGPNSKWIGPMANQSTGNLPGDYKYRLTFNLTGLEPSTAVITGRWTSDNVGPDILLNGVTTGFTSDGNFPAMNNTFTITSGFVDGVNTLDLVVNNAGDVANPTAVRVEISGTADSQPPPGTPPTIVTAPASQSVGLGESLVLTVSATGSRPLAYQWRRNGSPISTATSSTFAIPSVASSDAGNYDVIVGNSAGARTSSVAVVTVVFLNAAQRSYEPAGPSTRRSGVTFSEIMYHPTNRTDLRNGEFIELYNSNPFPEDLSGYRISGAVDYTFAEGVSIPALGYLVVAPAPADVTAIYGVNGVLGGFTNNLPNDAGTLRLRKKSGGVILEMSYSDQPPWPVAADGTGHSLVLARASYGENNPHAWAVSNTKDGSPGAADPVPAGALENVVINEILAHTDLPLLDYLELHNHSPLAVDISGAWLSDDAETNKFQIPANTVLPPGGFASFDETQLGFSLSAAGETIYFSNPAQTRVVDALRFEGQANGVAFGRWPDGEGAFRELADRTPGATNALPLTRPIVINEIMYNPISGDDDDQFIELHNRGASAVNLGGWRFTAGINYTFPPDTMMAAGAYLVVARNAALLRTNYAALNNANLVGDFGGSLAHGGERLALAMPDSSFQTNAQTQAVTTNRFYVVMNEVTYGDGGRWGKWSDGGGSSLELVDARSDNRIAPNWADSDETAKSEWTGFEHTGVLDLGHPTVTSINQLHFFLMDAGEALVDDLEVISSGVNRVSNPGFESGATGWTFRGTQRPSYVTNGGFSGTSALRLVASSRGDVVNRVDTTLTANLSPNSTATLRAKARWLRGHPELLLRVIGNSLEVVGRLPVPRNLGTPGAPNSRALANAGPAITEVTHRPVLPQAGQTVRVTARVQDVDGVQGVTLVYRVDPGTALNSVPMNDAGVNGDLLAGDGIYTGLIPGQSSGVIVAFRVQAGDAFSPSANAQYPEDAPTRECLVRFGETVPPGAFGTYRIWMTQATFDFWAAREKSSNEDVDTTFVYGDTRVVYNVGAHYGSSENYSTILSTPTGTLVGYNMDFPADDRLLGVSGVRLDWPNRDTTQLREITMYWLLDQYGLPNHYRRFIHLHINGIRRGTIYNDTQRPNGDSVEEWYPNDSEGDLFKLNPWYEATTAGAINAANFVAPRLQNTTTTGGVTKTAYYRFAWLPRAIHGTANDYSKLFAMIDAANAPASGYLYAVGCEIDFSQWMRTFAMNDLASYWDAFGNPNSKNSYLYRPQRGGWKIICWDFDVGLGTGNGGAQVQERPTAPLFDTGDPGLQRMNGTPSIVRHYWAALDEAMYGFFQPAAVQTFLADRYAALQAAGIDAVSPFVPSGTVPSGEPQRSIPDWITARRNFILTQLNTVSNVFSVAGSGFIETNNNLVTISGTAPVRVQTITVNGVAYAPVWTTVNAWQLEVPVAAGTNELVIAGVDRSGNVLSNRTVTVNYTGADEDPSGLIVINEIMYNPATPEASFVELFNRSTSHAFDLSGWRLNGIDYTFPPGTVLGSGQYLVIAKNPSAFGPAYGWNAPVLCQFDGQLDDGGETLTLIQPGVTPAEDLIVDRVTYDDDPPWPSRADGQGPSLQVIDSAQDNSRVSNWSDGAGWRFFSFTRPVGSSAAQLTNLAFFFQLPTLPGDVYLDDMSLVIGDTPAVGVNVLVNGGFEESLAPAWRVGAIASDTMITTDEAHSGNSSVHVVFSPGSLSLHNFAQNFAPLTPGTNYTLSFWYLAGSNGTNFSFRINSLFAGFIDPRPVLATPGAANAGAAPLPPYPALWISEAQPENVTGLTDNFGDNDPWVELYNGGDGALNLDGYHLANSYSDLAQWAFPAGTTIAPGQYLLVWADGEPGETAAADLHASFRLGTTGGVVALSRLLNGATQIVDYLNYGAVGMDRSFGALRPEESSVRQIFFIPTPRAANTGAAQPITLFINEWMAANAGDLPDPADQDFDDWFEIYNPTTNRVELEGFSLTDDFTRPDKAVIPAGITVPPLGYLLVWADEESGQTRTNGDLHINFRLSQNGEQIAFYDPAGRLIDSVVFGVQTNNVSQGRHPDGGAAPFHHMSTPTPRSSNIIPASNPPVLSIGLGANNTVTLLWSAQPGGVYRVQYKIDLEVAGWTDLGDPVNAVGSTASFTDQNVGGQRFYRVVLLP